MEKAFLNHFKISEEEIQRYLAENTQALPLIELLFEKKRIDEVEYLSWAKNYYGLPLLKESFFEAHNTVTQLTSRYRNIFPRNVIPFYEWDGVLYVMCLEPTPFEAPQKIQYVLAPLSLLYKYAPLDSTAIAKVASLPSIETKEITQTQPTEILQFEDTPDETQTVNLPTFEAPAGMESLSNVDFAKIDLNTDQPQGLSFPSAPEETKHEFVVDKEVKAEDLEEIKLKEIKNNHLPEEPSQEMTHTGIIIQRDGAIGIINNLKKYFDQAMILIYQNHTLKPLKWDSSWKKEAHTQDFIDLKSASIFRIVFDTKFPYHGYVIPNPINDAFFNGWNQGRYPEHVTIVPILENKNIVGMLLGTCSKIASQKFQVRHIETIAEECLKKVIRDQIKKAA
jgi:hypothetical protein